MERGRAPARAVAPARARAAPLMIGYLGLGSNVGDRRAHLQAAVDLLPVEVLACSSVYETEPVGEVLDQRAFLNACLRIETDLEPEALLDACKAVERERGRRAGRRPPRPAAARRRPAAARRPRATSRERLTLPHPRDVQPRAFVLVPLLELDPELGSRAGRARPAARARRWRCGDRRRPAATWSNP